MSISRYIAVAVARCSSASSRLPVRRYTGIRVSRESGSCRLGFVRQFLNVAVRIGVRTGVAPQRFHLLTVRGAASYNIETFRRGLAERGYSEGQNIALESRFADGRVEPL